MSGSGFERFLGGPPLRALAQLVMLSLVAGILMAALGLSPSALLRWGVDTVHRVVDMGFGAVVEVGRYVVIGAVVVIPLWLVLRLFSAGRRG